MTTPGTKKSDDRRLGGENHKPGSLAGWTNLALGTKTKLADWRVFDLAIGTGQAHRVLTSICSPRFA